MKDFKEWLSDYLRYFLLAAIIILIIGAAILGISIYSKVVNDGKGQKETTKQTETAKEPESQKESEKQTESEKKSEKFTEAQTEAPTEPPTER